MANCSKYFCLGCQHKLTNFNTAGKGSYICKTCYVKGYTSCATRPPAVKAKPAPAKKKRERSVENSVLNWTRKNKIKVKKKVFAEQLDRWFLLPGGKPFIVEFKRPGATVSKRQEYEINKLKELGYDVEVHHDKAEAIAAIEKRLAAAQLPKEGDKVPVAKRLRRAVP